MAAIILRAERPIGQGAFGRAAAEPALPPPLALRLTEAAAGSGGAAAEPARLIAARVYAGLAYSFELELSADELPAGAGHAAANLYLGGVLIETRQSDLADGRILLTPTGSGDVFADAFGFAALEAEIRRGGAVRRYAAEPAAVMIPCGPASENISRMAERVLERWKTWLAPEAPGESPKSAERAARRAPLSRAAAANPLDARLAALEEAVRVYETQFAYFRRNARFVLVPGSRIDAFEKLRDFSPETAAYMAQHPEELSEAPAGAGIRIGARTFLPRRTLVTTSLKSTDTYENRILLGFLRTLAGEAKAEAKEASLLLSQFPEARGADGWISTGAALLESAAEGLRRYASRASALEARLREMYLHYREAVPASEIPVPGIPEPTPAFLSIPAYRLVFDAIVRWRRAGRFELAPAEFLFSFLKRSRLYESYMLVRLLDELCALGLEPKSARRFDYRAPDSRWSPGDEGLANTFVFETPEAEAALYAQPVVPGFGYSAENGIALYRMTSLSTDGPGADASGGPWGFSAGGSSSAGASAGSGSLAEVRRSLRPFYTPDFIACVRRRRPNGSLGPARWLIADAKYSSRETVVKKMTIPLVFRYLFSIRPAAAADRIEGLWLFCGNDAAWRGPRAFAGLERAGDVAEALAAESLGPWGVEPLAGPDVHYEIADEIRRRAPSAAEGAALGGEGSGSSSPAESPVTDFARRIAELAR